MSNDSSIKTMFFDDTVETDLSPVIRLRMPEDGTIIAFRAYNDMSKIAARERPDEGPPGEWKLVEVAGQFCELPFAELGLVAGRYYDIHVAGVDAHDQLLTIEIL